MQKRKQSLTEAITNTLAGFVISFLIQLLIYPIMDIEVHFTQNIIITLVFTVASIFRGYVLRRLFNKFYK
jgi:hypothetical protein